MREQIIAFIILFFLYWYFIKKDQIIQIPIPPEKMTNISIFSNYNI
jgi:hypothetical protein